jgi:hypothetical protein
MSAVQPIVWCLCDGVEKPVMTTSDKCKGPPCNGKIIGDVVLAVRVREKFRKKDKKKKK